MARTRPHVLSPRCASVLSALILLSGCELLDSPASVAGDIDVVMQPAETPGTTYAIHVSGACSSDYSAPLGVWDGVTSISAEVDQHDSMATATADLASVLDQYCVGKSWCYVLTYSNGGGVVSKLFAESATQWNIAYVINSASNEGGSELGEFGLLSDLVGCDIATEIQPSFQRSWNHNDTNGNAFYMVGGYNGMFLTSWFLPGEDDGVVAYHSSAGASSMGSYTNLCEPTLWANHFIVGSCSGYDLTHAEMKRQHICLLDGGGPCH